MINFVIFVINSQNENEKDLYKIHLNLEVDCIHLILLVEKERSIFYLMGLFENWGGGTLQIITETIKSGKTSPIFSFEDGMFRLELFR